MPDLPVTDPPDADTIAYLLRTAVRSADEDRPRAQQKRDGVLGMSDMGFCRALALLTLSGVPDSDADNLWWKAVLGTSLGDTVELALAKMFPHWVYQEPLVATLQVGRHRPSIPGTPDILVPEWNMAIDNKTKDGLTLAVRKPWSVNYDYQTWLQVLAGMQAGILDPNRSAYQALAFWDRSGDDERVVSVAVKQWLPSTENDIAFWLDDVIDARLHDPHNLDPLRDVVAPVCERICAKFTVCRGSLPARDAEPLLDPEILEAVDAYIEGRALAKEGDRMKKDARAALRGIEGSTGEQDVRWTHIDASFTEGYETKAYDKIDVVKTRRRA